MATEDELIQVEGAVFRKLQAVRKSGRYRITLANDAYYAARAAIAEYEKLQKTPKVWEDWPKHHGEIPKWAK